MPRSKSRCRVWAAAFLGLWVFLLQGQDAFAELGYRLQWEANENEEGRLLQIYGQRLTLDLDQALTDRMSAKENINYNNRWEQEGLRKETVSPGASLAVNGDMFLANLSVNSVKNVGTRSFEKETDALLFAWASTWKKKLVPDLNATYDYTRQNTDLTGSANQNDWQSMGGQVNWDLLLAKVYYSYKHDISKYGNSTTTDDYHVAKFNAGRAWLDNRLQLALGHEYSNTRSENKFDFSTLTTANLFVKLATVYTGTDPIYSINALMQNGDKVASAYPVSSPTNNNGFVLFTNGQQVDHVYLYTLADLGPSPLGLNWRLYSTNDTFDPLIPALTTWTPVLGTPAYDTVNRRFVFNLPAITAAYLKVVVDLVPPAPNIDFTEVEADQVVHGVSGSTLTQLDNRKNNKSNFSLGYKLNHATAFSYSYFTEKEEADGIIKTDSESHNAALRLQNAAEDLKSVLSVSLLKSRPDLTQEKLNKTYRLSLNKIFLPTLSMALGGGREESTLGGSRLYDRNMYSFYSDAKLYPDLVSKIDATYWQQSNYNSAVGGGGKDDSFQGRMVFGARIRPTLNVALSDNYDEQRRNNTLNTKKNTIGLSGNWQVSDTLSLNATAQKITSKFDHDAYAIAAGMVAGLLPDLELKVDYASQIAAYKSQSGVATLHWTVRQNAYWEVGCNYAHSNIGGVLDSGDALNEYKVFSRVEVSFTSN